MGRDEGSSSNLTLLDFSAAFTSIDAILLDQLVRMGSTLVIMVFFLYLGPIPVTVGTNGDLVLAYQYADI